MYLTIKKKNFKINQAAFFGLFSSFELGPNLASAHFLKPLAVEDQLGFGGSCIANPLV